MIELDPEFKAELHAALSSSGTTMKAWFVREAGRYLATKSAFPMVTAENQPPEYNTGPNSGTE